MPSQILSHTLPPGSLLGSGRAPGKLILSGEHAVVYGYGAVAVPAPGVQAVAEITQGKQGFTIHVQHDDLNPAAAVQRAPQRAPGSDRDIQAALRAAVAAALDEAQAGADAAPSWPYWQLDVRCDVPLGRGMGSSAAMAVATVRAVGAALGAEWSAATAARLALAAERLTHGNPSGIDTTVVAAGRPIWFKRGQVEPIAVASPLSLVVADSGQPGSTKAMVAAVRAAREADPDRVDGVLRRIGDLAAAAREAMESGRTADLGRVLVQNHELLRSIGVSTPVLDQLVGAALKAEALGAKLSGAGGGGVVVALVESEGRAAVVAAFRAAGAPRVLELDVAAGRPAGDPC